MPYLICGFLIIAGIDFPPLIKKGKKWDLAVFSAFFAAVFAFAALEVIGAPIPSPMVLLGNLLKKIGLSY